jgi:predicted Na+-dependent transporter
MMRKVLLTTFLSTFLASLLLAISLLNGGEDSGRAIYGMILVLFFILVPIFLATLVYQFIKKRFLNNKYYSLLFGTLILFVIYQICIVVYVIIDVRSPLTINAVINEYKSEIAKFNIPVAILAFIVPLADFLVEWIRLEFESIKQEQQQR